MLYRQEYLLIMHCLNHTLGCLRPHQGHLKNLLQKSFTSIFKNPIHRFKPTHPVIMYRARKTKETIPTVIPLALFDPKETREIIVFLDNYL